jgi:hypothetical protein
MRKSFSYSLLKYRPSVFLDEQINIGILLTFPLERKVVFIAPSQLDRITYLFPKVELQPINQLLNQLKKKAYEITLKQINISHENLLTTFLETDIDGLFFSNTIEGSYLIADMAVKYYNKMYFEVYREVFRQSVNR